MQDCITLIWSLVCVRPALEYCTLKAHLRTCGLGQRVQHPLHNDIMPNECQSSMILHSSGDHPSVQSIQKSCSTAATVKKSQPHPATKRESVNINSAWLYGGASWEEAVINEPDTQCNNSTSA